MGLDEELDLYSRRRMILMVGSITIGIDYDEMKDEYDTPDVLILEQAPGTWTNAGAATASTGIGAAGSSAVWSTRC